MTDRLLDLIALLVPAFRRDDWLREWRAELAYQRTRRAGGARHLLDALEDAVTLRARSPGLPRVGRDLRYAARTLGRRPLFAVVVVATLALGIGANTTIFSLLYDSLLRPLPYHQPEELVVLAMTFRHGGEAHPAAASEPEYLDLDEEADAFTGLAAFARTAFNLGGLDQPQRVAGAWVSADLLEVLGVRPLLGRGFLPDEERPGAPPVAIVSHRLWQGALGADPGVLGRDVLLDGRPRRVVGVLPSEFEFPVGRAELLVPLTVDPANPGGRSSHYLELMGRLARGLDPSAGQARLDDLLRGWERTYPDRHDPDLEGHPINVMGLREHMVGDHRASLLLAMGAVGLVLLIACANVANLMLVRAESRRREMALRRALGAGRRDLVQQLLVESLVLGVLGALGALVLAEGGLRLLEVAGGTLLPGLPGGGLDGPVLGFTLAVGVVTSVGFGLASALLAGGRGLGSALAGAGHRTTSDRRGLDLRRTLVVAEVGTAVLLVVGAGLLLRSVARLQGVDPGFEPAGVVVASFSLSSGAYPGPDDVARFHRELDGRLRAMPGVEEVGAVRILPLRDGAVPIESIELVDAPRTDDDAQWVVAGYQVVSPGYFRTLGIPLLQGRHPEWSDDAGGVPVAIINRSMARAFWSGGDPLGRRFRLGPPESGNPVLTVVGVVGDVRQAGLTRAAAPHFFVPRAQASAIYGGLGTRYATLVVRAGTGTAATLRGVREAIRDVDPELPLVAASSLENVVARAQGDTRSLGVLLGALSALALVLGAVGIYGLMAYSVSRRSREIGVRITLGAGRGQVVGSVLREALTLTAVGAALGVAGALGGARVLESLLYGVGVRDPLAFTGGPAILLAVAALAAFLPARRAARIDPTEALRQE